MIEPENPAFKGRRMHRYELDQVAWRTLHSVKLASGEPSGLAKCGRPANFKEFGELVMSGRDFGLAWSEYLHEFYRYQRVSFFAVPPPEGLEPSTRAMLAGTAEVLCAEFGLETPEWVHEPEFTLNDWWDPLDELLALEDQDREARIAKAHPLFLKHGVIMESRALIAL